MKTKLMMMVAIVALFALSSCGDSKESYVKDFTKFVEKVKADCGNYSADDWKKANEKFDIFVGSRYEKFSSELSMDELVEITKLKATYATLQLKQGASILKKELDKAIDKSSKEIDNLLKEK